MSPLTRIIKADTEQTRILHEAFQYLTLKKKKKSGRSMVENWGKVGEKAMMLKAGKLPEKSWTRYRQNTKSKIYLMFAVHNGKPDGLIFLEPFCCLGSNGQIDRIQNDLGEKIE